MIEVRYKINLKEDDRALEIFFDKNLTKAECSDAIRFLENVKINLVLREFELGEGGFEVCEDDN